MVKSKKRRDDAVLLQHLGHFSRNMINNHHLENLSEFVLHDLCSEKGFEIRKSAYLINNPDFQCLKGVAGYYHPESYDSGEHWQEQKDFTAHMNSSDFNKAVRAYSDVFSNSDISKKKIEELVEYLEIEDPAYHTWNSKHNNQGIFIFQRPEVDMSDDHLLSFLHMLSFCPIF